MGMTEKEHIINISDHLYDASKSIRILRSIAWPLSVKEEFFKHKAEKLPQVNYPTLDQTDTLKKVDLARKQIPKDFRFQNWGMGIANILENGSRLLSSLGTKEFHTYSTRLYGAPLDKLPDEKNTSLDLANHFEEMYVNIQNLNINSESIADFDDKAMQAQILSEVSQMFGEDAPAVIIDEEVSSKVIAGRRRIRIRKGARFSDMDLNQLVHHEAFIHVATSLNGHFQTDLKILAASHPGTTKTQEGLAVFAEYITGNLDLDRLRRLSDRIIAIQMAIDGADFIDLYRYYLTKTDIKEDAYENARRVCRGGLVTGGAPFTKDIVYLDGLLNVHNFLRTVVSDGRADLLPLLFVGKLNIEDLGEMVQFKKMGLLKDSTYLPPWIKDIRFLLTYLAYSSFLNKIKLTDMKDHYRKMLYEL